jgi:hypothetical protein
MFIRGWEKEEGTQGSARHTTDGCGMVYLRMEAVDGRLSVERGRRRMLMMGTVN